MLAWSSSSQGLRSWCNRCPVSAILHEMGQLAGLSVTGAGEDDLMALALTAGVRRTDALDAAFSQVGTVRKTS